MNTFLHNVASRLLSDYGRDLSRIAVVFPNKRASLFLNEQLAIQSGQPIWSPVYITISDLFRTQSKLQVADPIKLVCDLHRSFVSCTGMEETLDHFYSWGQLLLSDFDDVDKHMAPADKVFANIRDIHELDDDSYLTQNQRDIIRKFFSNFKDGQNSELKQRFLSLWSHISDIYHDFNARLTAQGLAYEGALYRQVIETEASNFPYDQYVFVGFNLLHPVELALIRHLESMGKAQLIQDTDEDCPKQVAFIAASTENIQARYISKWLKENGRMTAGKQTAIVLADESLLQSAIHSLPDKVKKVNITTGYPLLQTAIASDILQQVAQEASQHATSAIAPLLQRLIEDVKESGYKSAETEASAPLHAEAHFRMFTLLNRLLDLVNSGDLNVTLPTLLRLLRQIIVSTTIPFHGEPIEGVQIMGVLETRNLDFKHILLLSCNEGNLPKGINDTSFIPYSIRKAYGLTTVDNKVAIYQNYFRRLLQRASDVTIVYNNSTNNGKTGEMSRFMLEMMVEARHPITFCTLQAGQQAALRQPRPVCKTQTVMEQLRRRFDSERQKPGIEKHPYPLLTPSAVNRYQRCPLMFFYYYVCGLSEQDEEDVLDNRLFGNIFHQAAENIYKKLMQRSKTITTDGIKTLLKDQVDIQMAVDQAIKLELFHIEDSHASMPPLDGLQIINREVIIKYLCQLLELDLRQTPFTIIGLEKDVVKPFYIQTQEFSIHTTIGGRIDRLDQVSADDSSAGSTIRVIDYKTGSRHPKPLSNVDAIFQQENLKNHSDYYLQAFLYALIVRQDSKDIPVCPALLFIQHAGSDDYSPILSLDKEPVSDIRKVEEPFMQHFKEIVNQIFDPTQPFMPTDDHNRCRNCPYATLCGI